MALGLPVVSTAVGGIPYLIEHNKDGILVDLQQAKPISEAILYLVNSIGKVKQLSHNAREKAKDHDWEHIVEHWTNLLT
jgi:glycosyltransferase involved in cell wall biosynthesis